MITISLSVAFWLNRQLVVDAASYFNYQPTPIIEQISDSVQLTDVGRFYFYADNPSVEAGLSFNIACKNKESGTAVLGCYNGENIFIFDVNDERLNGIEEVTAAHELLHAIYVRMSDEDRARINKLVEAEYVKLKDDPQFSKRMAYYARTEPGERDNELHSIIGTEVGSISAELEDHYKQYFKNRSKIVAYHNSYNTTFTKLADQAKSLADKMDKLSKKVSVASDKYNSDVKKLNTDIADFNKKAAAGGFTTQAQFDEERQSLVDRVAQLSQDRKNINNDEKLFNKLRDAYNSIVTQSNDLYNSIDSSLAQTPQV